MNRPGPNRNKIHGNVQSNKIRGAPPPKRAFSLSRIHKDTDDTDRLTCGLMECVSTNGEIELNLIVHCQKHIMESQANNGPKLTCITCMDDVSLPLNHAPVIVVFSAKEMQCCSATLDDLEQRTSELGAYASEANFRSRFTQRQIRWSNVDSGCVRELLDFHDPPDIDAAADIEAVFQNVDDTIRSCISQARIADVVPNSVTANPWKKLAEENDSRKIWDAIN